MHPLLHDTISTPLGDFSVAVDSHGALVATAFGDRDRLRRRLQHCHLLATGLSTTAGDNAADGMLRDESATAAVLRQVGEYFAGKRRHFDLELAGSGSEFQRRVWTALREIPYGETRSYGQLARQLGTTSARAVGRANATNPICLIVPCHRVIGANGSLTGFAFGEEIKRGLLEFERRMASAAAAA